MKPTAFFAQLLPATPEEPTRRYPSCVFNLSDESDQHSCAHPVTQLRLFKGQRYEQLPAHPGYHPQIGTLLHGILSLGFERHDSTADPQPVTKTSSDLVDPNLNGLA